MKKILAIIPMLLLTACATTKECQPTVEYKTVTRKVPEALLVIPEYPADPNLNGTQKDIALWIIQNEKRSQQMENQIKQIKEFNDKE
jgi:hypothetical protein